MNPEHSDTGNPETQALPPPSSYDQSDSDQTCFLCGKPRYEPLYDTSEFGFPLRFQRCQCGLIKQTPMPNEAFFEWFFNSEVFFSSKKTEEDFIWGYYDYFADEPSRIATSKWRYRKLRRHFDAVGRPLRIVKVGPATGTFLHVAKEHGHEVRGADVSSRFAEYARSQYGVEIDIGRFEKMDYADGQFDALVLLNVVENVPNLAEFMGAVKRTVQPGGLFILNYVDMFHNIVAKLQKERYFLCRPPVCYMFTHAVLVRMLEQFGFKVVGIHHDIRYMHIEKMATLLRWSWMLRLGRLLRISRIPLRVLAYPSKIVVAKRVG